MTAQWKKYYYADAFKWTPVQRNLHRFKKVEDRWTIYKWKQMMKINKTGFRSVVLLGFTHTHVNNQYWTLIYVSIILNDHLVKYILASSKMAEGLWRVLRPLCFERKLVIQTAYPLIEFEPCLWCSHSHVTSNRCRSLFIQSLGVHVEIGRGCLHRIMFRKHVYCQII